MCGLIAANATVEFGATRATQTSAIFHDFNPVRHRPANAVKL